MSLFRWFWWNKDVCCLGTYECFSITENTGLMEFVVLTSSAMVCHTVERHLNEYMLDNGNCVAQSKLNASWQMASANISNSEFNCFNGKHEDFHSIRCKVCQFWKDFGRWPCTTIAYFTFTYFEQVFLLNWKELVSKKQPLKQSNSHGYLSKSPDFSQKFSNLAINENAFTAVFNPLDMLGHCLWQIWTMVMLGKLKKTTCWGPCNYWWRN